MDSIITAKREYSKISWDEEDDWETNINRTIRTELEENKKKLAEVKIIVQQRTSQPSQLSLIDAAHIEKKYAEYWQELWLNEVEEIISSSKTDIDGIPNFLTSLERCQNVRDIFEPFNRKDYYKLLPYDILLENEKQEVLHKFKIICLCKISNYTENASAELEFLNKLVDFLNNVRNFQNIIKDLSLEDFCADRITLNDFLKKISTLDSSESKDLITLATSLEQITSEQLKGKFQETLRVYLQPIEINACNKDGRAIVEVIGKNVSISEIIIELEQQLENKEIDEVRFVCNGVIHIDKGLQNPCWRGRNVVILTKKLKIYDEITWDVSGSDNTHIYTENAGTDEYGYGRKGEDGYSGESGGNVVILAEMIDGFENLTLISNGGDGSKGQDGGNGLDGANGKSISKSDFQAKFPATADFDATILNRSLMLKKKIDILRNMNEPGNKIKTVWYSAATNATIERIIRDLEVMYNRTIGMFNFNESIFVEVISRDGHEITFSYQYEALFAYRAAFVLHKGSPGEPGKNGGEYGLAGEGGYPGNIMISKLWTDGQNVTVDCITEGGQKGDDGTGGLYGKPGKSGSDMGYIDYQLWSNGAVIYQPGKYAIKYFNTDSENRVWCPYKKAYAAIVAATDVDNVTAREHQERQTTRTSKSLQQHAQATKKKHISESTLKTTYSNHFNVEANQYLHNFDAYLGSLQQKTNALQRNLQQQAPTQQFQVMRHVNYSTSAKTTNIISFTRSSNAVRSNSKTNFKDLLAAFHAKSLLVPIRWQQFKDVELNMQELILLLEKFDTLKKSVPKDTQREINTFLIDKYRICVFQQLSRKLKDPENFNVTL